MLRNRLRDALLESGLRHLHDLFAASTICSSTRSDFGPITRPPASLSAAKKNERNWSTRDLARDARTEENTGETTEKQTTKFPDGDIPSKVSTKRRRFSRSVPEPWRRAPLPSPFSASLELSTVSGSITFSCRVDRTSCGGGLRRGPWRWSTARGEATDGAVALFAALRHQRVRQSPKERATTRSWS